MDPDVLAAIARWPDVPAVFGWLALTARGQWRLRGEGIDNAAIRAFIGRNYALDAQGRAYFQNGPQRVYVSLEVTPWIYRIEPGAGVMTHTGVRAVRCDGAALLDDGRLLLVTDIGAGAVDDRDAEHCLAGIADASGRALVGDEIERWLDGVLEACFVPARLGLAGTPCPVERLSAASLDERFGFVREPQPAQMKVPGQPTA